MHPSGVPGSAPPTLGSSSKGGVLDKIKKALPGPSGHSKNEPTTNEFTTGLPLSAVAGPPANVGQAVGTGSAASRHDTIGTGSQAGRDTVSGGAGLGGLNNDISRSAAGRDGRVLTSGSGHASAHADAHDSSNKPSMGDKIGGTFEKLKGSITNNPAQKEEGSLRKDGELIR